MALHRRGEEGRRRQGVPRARSSTNLRTNIVGFGGFGSSIVLILRGGILMSIGDFPESLSQAIIVGIMLVWRLGVVYFSVRILWRFAETNVFVQENGPTSIAEICGDGEPAPKLFRKNSSTYIHMILLYICMCT